MLCGFLIAVGENLVVLKILRGMRRTVSFQVSRRCHDCVTTEIHTGIILAAIIALLATFIGSATAAERTVGKSVWGPGDEIGLLNVISSESRKAILSRISGGAVCDLSVEYFIGMPSSQAAGDPHYRIWMTHTPHEIVIG